MLANIDDGADEGLPDGERKRRWLKACVADCRHAGLFLPPTPRSAP